MNFLATTNDWELCVGSLFYWELLEPEEGEFDFTLIDCTIQQARRQQLKVVFLWFGAWKNSMSCYAPLWVKQDTKRFPRARTRQGKPREIASCFSEQVFQADNRASRRFRPSPCH